MRHTDTEGLLDACGECGARAGWESKVAAGRRQYRAGCTECHGCGDWHDVKDVAMTEWNVRQRR